MASIKKTVDKALQTSKKEKWHRNWLGLEPQTLARQAAIYSAIQHFPKKKTKGVSEAQSLMWQAEIVAPGKETRS